MNPKIILPTQEAWYKELMAYYRCAIMEAETKFKVLDEEFSLANDRNPIEAIRTRLKTTESIAGKLERKGLEPTAENISEHISDIAGIRVICSYPSDIYMLAEAFLKQDDVKLVERQDYIRQPKPSGYRSLHLIVETPIFLHDRKKIMKAEIQLRTLSMDWWASIEHKIRYKKDLPEDETRQLEIELRNTAEMAAVLDERMESIGRRMEKYL